MQIKVWILKNMQNWLVIALSNSTVLFGANNSYGQMSQCVYSTAAVNSRQSNEKEYTLWFV